MGNSEICHRLEFYAGGERKPWRVFTISATFVPEVYWLYSFPGLPLQSEVSLCFSLFCKHILPQPPSHKKVKIPQNHYLKSGTSGTFSACKCVQFESPGLLFHLLWYAYLIHRPRLDLIWCTLVQGWWWATSEGSRQRVVFSVLSVGPLFWSTVLPRGFICTWNAESISTYWLWIMTAKKEV